MLVCFFQDGNKIISCGADKAARLYDVSTGQQSQVAAHDAPIKNLRWIDQNGGILATGSWDKTVKVSSSNGASLGKRGKCLLTLSSLMSPATVLGLEAVATDRNRSAG